MSKVVKKTTKPKLKLKSKPSKKKTVKKTTKKETKSKGTGGLGYVKKILNPNTGRYVKLESKLGKSISKRLDKLVKKGTRTTKEQKYVDDILYSKFCKCTKSVIISQSKKKCPPCADKRLPYAVCTNNVYIRRGMKIKSNGSSGCRKTFSWYK
tara:strand:- start:756 stop:1214 length:459 start_codon:yes stop_codon:yes gene_type:complete